MSADCMGRELAMLYLAEGVIRPFCSLVLPLAFTAGRREAAVACVT